VAESLLSLTFPKILKTLISVRILGLKLVFTQVYCLFVWPKLQESGIRIPSQAQVKVGLDFSCPITVHLLKVYPPVKDEPSANKNKDRE